MSQVSLAQELGVSPSALSDVLARRRDPGPKLLKAMKLRKRVIYEPIGKAK